jgi:citrate synthase
MKETTVTAQPQPAGLEGVVVAESEISFVDGQEGRLVYRGYSIEELAAGSTFEETSKLLLDGELPTRAELQAFERALSSERPIDERTLEALRGYPADVEPMSALRTGVSALGMVDPDRDDDGPEATRRKAIRLIAKLPTLVAAFERFRKGDTPVAPREDLGHSANFLYMLDGKEPDREDARVMDVCLILHAEHGMNASTFAARVTAATLSDIHSDVCGRHAQGAAPRRGESGSHEHAARDRRARNRARQSRT